MSAQAGSIKVSSAGFESAHVLIIAIDKYKSVGIRDLKGCINDAVMFKAFLNKKLRIPDSNITCLINNKATREGILSAINDLHKKVWKGAPIIIFYAGHGSRVRPPKGWNPANEMIEIICPHDERTKDTKGKYIHGIPDRTINRLLDQLKIAKGDNITVILDTCHAGGMTRKSPPEPIPDGARTVFTETALDEMLDYEIWSQYGRAANVNIPPRFRYMTMSSHILLAACGQDEYAHEFPANDGLMRGHFTKALVETFESLDFTFHRYTYSELVSSLPSIQQQTPQCEGEHKNRVLFSTSTVDDDSKLFQLTRGSTGVFTIEVGSFHGVVRGTQFAVMAQSSEVSRPRYLGNLISHTVGVYSSSLRFPKRNHFDIPTAAWASVADWGNNTRSLNVYLRHRSARDPSHVLGALLQSEHVPKKSIPSFIKVESIDKADIAIHLQSDGKLIIDRLDPFIREHANRRTTILPNNKSQVPSILNAISKFNYHLARHPDTIQLDDPLTEGLGNCVSIGLHILGGSRFSPKPIGENLLVANHAELRHDEHRKYGIVLTNSSNCNLFPYLFYFDPRSYGIEVWYQPHSDNAPLGAQRGPAPSLPIFGPNGGFGFEFIVPKGEKEDTGFLKLFVTTQRVNMDFVAQPPLPNLDRRLGQLVKPPEDWDALCAIVTVKRTR